MSDPRIHQAIQYHRLLSIHDGRTCRVVEPHAYALQRDGSEILWCFQISGGSASGNPIGWKVFRLSKLRSLRPLQQTFGRARRGWKRYRQRALRRVYCEIDDVDRLDAMPPRIAQSPLSRNQKEGGG